MSTLYKDEAERAKVRSVLAARKAERALFARWLEMSSLTGCALNIEVGVTTYGTMKQDQYKVPVILIRKIG